MSEPRLFTLVRKGDESGVSGIGRVLDGALFHTGQVVICWRTDVEAKAHGYSSLGIYPSWEAFEFLHIKSHPTNGTEVQWLPIVAADPGEPYRVFCKQHDEFKARYLNGRPLLEDRCPPCLLRADDVGNIPPSVAPPQEMNAAGVEAVPETRHTTVDPNNHAFVQWREKPDYQWCMAYVPDGPGWMRLCRKVRDADAHANVAGEADKKHVYSDRERCWCGEGPDCSIPKEDKP